jgi:hypothetical protein
VYESAQYLNVDLERDAEQAIRAFVDLVLTGADALSSGARELGAGGGVTGAW